MNQHTKGKSIDMFHYTRSISPEGKSRRARRFVPQHQTPTPLFNSTSCQLYKNPRSANPFAVFTCRIYEHLITSAPHQSPLLQALTSLEKQQHLHLIPPFSTSLTNPLTNLLSQSLTHQHNLQPSPPFKETHTHHTIQQRRALSTLPPSTDFLCL